MVGALDGERPSRASRRRRWAGRCTRRSFGDLLRGLHERTASPVPDHRERRGDARHRSWSTAGSSTTTASSTSPHTSARCTRRSRTACRSRATSPGRCSTTSSGRHGYGPRFGLVEVDMKTQRRTPKHSALWYAEVAEPERSIPPHNPSPLSECFRPGGAHPSVCVAPGWDGNTRLRRSRDANTRRGSAFAEADLGGDALSSAGQRPDAAPHVT